MNRACRVVTSEISARILIAAQLQALDEFRWTVIAGDEMRTSLDGVEQVQITMRRELALADFVSFIRLLRYFRANRFAFIQTHTPKASMLALPAARLAGQRTVYTMHGAMYFRGNGRLANLAGWAFERWCCSWAHVVSMQSAEDTEEMPRVHACPKRKVRYQGNGIDLERFTNVPDSSSASNGPSGSNGKQPKCMNDPCVDLPDSNGLPVVLNISRLVKEKGCLDFFALAERLAGKALFVHVGPQERDQRDAVGAGVIDDLSRRQIVHFVGEVNDVRPYLRAADIFVLPSFREGIPRGCMEAAAMGLAVAAYDVRGVREVVPEGFGLLAPRGDIDALTETVTALLDDPAARQAAAKACGAHVRSTFDERLVYERLRVLYAGLLNPDQPVL